MICPSNSLKSSDSLLFIDHGILLMNLSNLGIRRTVFIVAFLFIPPSQAVEVGAETSLPCTGLLAYGLL